MVKEETLKRLKELKQTTKTVYMAVLCREQYQGLINEYPLPKIGDLCLLCYCVTFCVLTVLLILLFLPENVFLWLVYLYFTPAYWVCIGQIACLFNAQA